MILNVLYLSIALPLSIQGVNSLPANINKPYLVQAVIDSARIIGLPPSRAARDYAQKLQIPDPVISQFYSLAEPVSWRRLFFRKYFQ